MRGVSVVVLFFSFLQKSLVIAYIVSTLVRAVSHLKHYQMKTRNGLDNDDNDDYILNR